MLKKNRFKRRKIKRFQGYEIDYELQTELIKIYNFINQF